MKEIILSIPVFFACIFAVLILGNMIWREFGKDAWERLTGRKKNYYDWLRDTRENYLCDMHGVLVEVEIVRRVEEYLRISRLSAGMERDCRRFETWITLEDFGRDYKIIARV